MKDILFMIFEYLGVIFVILLLLLLITYLLNKITRATKYIIMYHEYKKNKELYNIRNNLIISKNGKIAYSCTGDFDEQIEILNKAISHIEYLKKLKNDIYSPSK